MTDIGIDAIAEEWASLIALADRAVAVTPAFDAALVDWRARAKDMVDGPGGLAGESALNDLALEFRRRWLLFAQGYSARILRSPEQGPEIVLPTQARTNYPYDRWNTAELLEERARAYHPEHPGWERDCLLYSSGMGALTALLLILRERYSGRRRVLKTLTFGAYFEVASLLGTLADRAFAVRMTATQNRFQEVLASGEPDFVFCQSVANTFDLEPLDVAGLARAWKAAGDDRPRVLIVDTSLTGNAFPFEELLDALKGLAKPSLIARLSSGLKLDQEGLEWANAGLLTLYAPAGLGSADRDQTYVQRRAKRLRRRRQTFGLGLNIDALAALEFPSFLDAEAHRLHVAAVFAANRALAETAPADNGILSAKAYPGLLGPAPAWAGAPFVNFRIAGGDRVGKRMLRYLFKRESRQRGLDFVPGSSFGFRSHRFEMGIDDPPGEATFRVAMGRRAGPQLDGVLQLFKDLAAQGDMAALRAAYPDLAERASRREAEEQAKKKNGSG